MKRKAFSLIEVLFAIILVGLAVAALVGASGSLSRVNAAGTELSTAEFLLEQIKELTATLPVKDPETEDDIFGPEEGTLGTYDDLDDFDGATISPPVDAQRTVLNDFAEFTQQVTVENVSQTDFEQVVADHSSPFVRVTARVLRNGDEICSASWIRADY